MQSNDTRSQAQPPPDPAHPTIVHGEALATMREMADGCVHLILVDPPYFRVKGEAWDNQWDTAAGFLAWVRELAVEWRRILAPNGSLYVFASPRMSARVEVTVGEVLAILNSIVWSKPAFSTKAEMFDKSGSRAYFPASERVVFAGHLNHIGSVIEQARGVAGLTRAQLASHVGVDSRLVQKWEERDPDGQHSLISSETFELVARVLGIPDAFEVLCRPFTVSASVPYTDVWTYPTVAKYPGKHPCEKPRDMIADMIRASSRPGDHVLDCFLGSGVTGEQAVKLGRRFTGVERGHYIHGARRRIANAVGTVEAALDANEYAPSGTQLGLL